MAGVGGQTTIQQNVKTERFNGVWIMSIMEKEYLKQLNEANKKIETLKRERVSLLRKLKGVRAARERDLAKADERLRNEIASSSSIIQSLLDRKAEARADRLDFILWYLQHNWIESGKISLGEWEDFYLAAADAYAKKYKEEVE